MFFVRFPVGWQVQCIPNATSMGPYCYPGFRGSKADLKGNFRGPKGEKLNSITGFVASVNTLRGQHHIFG